MIAALVGILQEKNNSSILIQVSSGVSFEVLIPESISLPNVGQEYTIYTHLIVREQEMYLVGFASMADKKLFEVLITAKGIGPKQGLKILSDIPGTDLRIAIVSGDISRLSKIKGISTKKAEQIILDLQEKMKKEIGDSSIIHADPLSKQRTEVLLTMRALGYNDHEVKKSLDKFFDSQEIQGKTTENLVSEFLVQFSKHP
ncbi:MAG: Holliday junction branch migration protein RuvA [Brevinema sp.]